MTTPSSATNSAALHHAHPPLLWDVFCRVIDNLGDIGVCWRFCTDLAERGHNVRLWVDEPTALAWMAPGARDGQVNGIEVIHWTEPLDMASQKHAMADVWVEAFGCDAPAEWTDALMVHLEQGKVPPVWLNLEYLSAESYVERCHGLPSPIMNGPLSGQTRWYFYPGFTTATGGLLRETGLMKRRADHDPVRWLGALGVAAPDERRKIGLFCYEPPVLAQVLQEVAAEAPSTCWMVTPGRACHAVDAALAELSNRSSSQVEQPCVFLLPSLPQIEFDQLLWSSDLNFVRGEDSLVRALWAGQAFVWHIYPQHDNAHHAKLEAFLDWLQAPASLRRFHRLWNGVDAPTSPVWPGWNEIDTWRQCALDAQQRLLGQPDLTSQLLDFVSKKR